MNGPRYNGHAANDLKAEAEKLRGRHARSHGPLNPDLIEFTIAGERYLRYPDGDFRDRAGDVIPNPEALLRAPVEDQDEPIASVQLQPIADHEECSLDPAWAYGDFLIAGAASMLAGLDGTGKSAQAVAVILTFVTGKALLGEPVHRPGPVAILAYEDDLREWHRRIRGACRYHALDYRAALSKIHFIARKDRDITLAAHGPGRGIVYPDRAELIAVLEGIRPALLIIDPLSHAHSLDDGNSNALLAQVAREIGRVAAALGCAALVMHHLRKGANGELDDIMGATMLRATFRVVRVLARITKTQAEEFDIAEDETWRYSGIASSKTNYSPPTHGGMFYRLVSVPHGASSVQVIERWQPNKFTLDKARAMLIFGEFRKGPSPDEFYLANPKAGDDWAGVPIMRHTDANQAQAEQLLRDWRANRMITQAQYRSPKRRKWISRIAVNESVAASILGSVYRPAEGSE